jgi:hypothetical protein
MALCRRTLLISDNDEVEWQFGYVDLASDVLTFVFGATRRGGPFGDIALDALNVQPMICEGT